jgi:hypothetical protein
VGNVDPPTFAPGAPATLNLTIEDLVTGAGAPDINVNVCAKADSACVSPNASGVTDAIGQVTLALPVDGPQYVELSGPGIGLHLSYPNDAPPSGRTIGFSLAVISIENLSEFGLLSGITLDPSRGSIGIGVQDCVEDTATGIEIAVDSADAQTAYTYLNFGGVPDPGLTATSEAGRAGAFNVPPGPVVLTATLVATGEVIGTRTATVRAGALTLMPDVDPQPE